MDRLALRRSPGRSSVPGRIGSTSRCPSAPRGPLNAVRRIVFAFEHDRSRPTLASQSRVARSATASRIGFTSPGESEITRRISLVAVCCSRPSLVSLNRRTFSIAITAWSAKVRSSAICFSVSGPGSRRTTLIAPIAASPRIIGMMVSAREPLARKFFVPRTSGAPVWPAHRACRPACGRGSPPPCMYSRVSGNGKRVLPWLAAASRPATAASRTCAVAGSDHDDRGVAGTASGRFARSRRTPAACRWSSC